MGSDPEPLKSDDAIKTYRYLRIGMIGAVVLLTTSIVIERSKVDCWQTSISAYYYTPVRAIFVGSMMAVGLSLIVYKGRRFLEDAFLNFAGMLAPIVAVVPTTDVGTCWSLAPIPRPLQPPDDSLADWVVANIDNNVYALLITGAIGLGIAFVIAMLPRPNIRGLFEDEGTRATTLSLILTGVGLLVALWLIRDWSDFYTLAHGYAAVAMFVLLVLAVIANVWEHRDQRNEMWFWIYAAVAALMILGGIVIPWTRVFGEHTTFALEAYEIAFFAIYWICQTGENWDEKLVGLPPPDPA